MNAATTIDQTWVAPTQRGWVTWLFLGVLGFATVIATALSNGDPIVSTAPMMLSTIGYIVWKTPLRNTALAVVFMLLIGDYLFEGPYSGLWQSPFYPLGKILFLNLSALTGISALRFPLLDLLVVMIIAIGAYRRATGINLDPRTPSVHALNRFLVLQILAVIALDLWGVATGGDFNESLWQLRQLLLFPIMTLCFLHAIPGRPEDFRQIAKVAIAAAVIKSICGVYFIYFIVHRIGTIVEFTTSHSDTLLFVPLLAMQIALWLEKGTQRYNWAAWVWVPIVLWGMIANDRRIAYVSLGAGVFCMVLMTPWSRTKRRISQAAILLAPLIIVYTAAGWNSKSPVFWGSQLMKSLIKGDQAQAGADYRDIENFDVLYTWSEHAILPLGFGHKFEEPVKLPDISFAMPTYQFHPHNTILWMWSIGGWLGFSLLFLPWMTCVYLAARSYRFATNRIDRVLCLTAICFVIAFINQCFGDMGTRTYFGSMLGALLCACVSKLAIRTGAWTSGAKAT